MRAYIDESGSISHQDPGVYILGAVIIDDDRDGTILHDLKRLQGKSKKKLHWNTESDARRIEIAEVLGKSVYLAVVVVNQYGSECKQERARRKACEQLYRELEQLGVTDVIFESRGTADDKRDRKHLDGLKQAKQFSGIKAFHEPGSSNPLLWLADALCGSVVQSRVGEHKYLQQLGEDVLIVEVS